MKHTCLTLLGLLVACHWLTAQTNIGGIINSYAPVTAIANAGCSSSVTVTGTATFAVGDKVLIIQMKGAFIDSANSTAFGNVLNLNGAGSYEFSRIAAISGNLITLTNLLQNSYFIPGLVQLVKVPGYANATVTTTLQAQPWNGTSGGILAFLVSGTLTLNADINVNGLGFRGGTISNNPDGGCGNNNSSSFFYPLVQPGANWLEGGAMKGEGIAAVGDDKMAGKGNLANGGGGGNKHNTGGGGGGNFSGGGLGGEVLVGCTRMGNTGIGGLSMAAHTQTNKLFLGGGGGCGDDNNGVGSIGANGGGIVIIRANTVSGNAHTVFANGADELVVGGDAADGVGGGGGGGLVFLDVATYNGALTVQANGGQGGDQSSTYGCVGTGGGGGTGGVITAQPSLPANVTVTTLPGRAGTFIVNNVSCGNYFATAGQPNTVGPVFNLPFMESSATGSQTVNLGNDTALCIGQTLQLNAGTGGISYLWQDGSTAATFTVTTAGQYWVQVTAGACTSRDTITVTYTAPPVIELGNDTTLCTGAILALNQTGTANNFLWQDNITAQVYTVTQAGLYILDASNAGCHVRDTIRVDYVGLNIELGPDTTLCTGTTLSLNATVNNATYLWQDGSTGPLFTVLAAGLYKVVVNLSRCTVADSILVTYTPKPAIELGTDTVLCNGNTLLLNQAGVALSWLWQDNSTAQTYTVTAPGVYIVQARNSGCLATDSIKVNYASLDIELGNDTTFCTGAQVQLSVSCLGCSYLWSTGATDSLVYIANAGNYNVQATNFCGTVSDSKQLLTTDCACILYMPNAFTPNGDGNNEELLPVLDCELVFYHLTIFDRWGELVFESNNAHTGWDGTFKNKPSMTGVYVYTLTYSGKESTATNTYKLKGSITLIR